jgi:hypothetical protein
LVADKIKSTLPEACLDHVLTSEGKTWLECDALADTCDIYFANHTVDGRPKSVRSEFRARNNNASENVHKGGIVNADERGTVSANAQVNGPRGDTKGAKTGGPSQPVSKGDCVSHVIHQVTNRQIALLANLLRLTGEARVAARNFACAVESPRFGSEVSQSQQQSSQLNDAGDRNKPSPMNEDGGRSYIRYNLSNPVRSTEVNSAQAYSASSCERDLAQPIDVVQRNSMANDVAKNAKTLHSARTILSEHNDICTHDLIANNLSKLNYVLVQIKGIDHVHNALNDRGSAINLIRRSLVQLLTQLPSRGRVKIKGIVGPAVETAIVLLDVSPAATETNWVNIAPPLSELSAVRDDLNEPIISTADTVHRLSTLKRYESVVIPEPAETVVNQTCENNETFTHN